MRIGLAVILAAAAVAVSQADEAADKELKHLQGAWKIKSFTFGAVKPPAKETEGIRWTFKGNELTIGAGTDKDEKYTVKLDPTKNPRHIDTLGLKDPKKGITDLGLYELKGGTLTICLTVTVDKRPTELKPTRGCALIVLEKADK